MEGIQGMLRKRIGIWALAVCGVIPVAFSADQPKTPWAVVQQRLAELPPEHPRLWVGTSGVERLQKIRKTSDGKRFEALILHEAGLILQDPPVQRVLEGKRMLTVARLALYRMTTLGMAYLLTSDQQYAHRGILELESVCAFSDWNPSHFLDVGELTFAVAIGLDWFDRELTDEQRRIIRTSIVEKALLPSFTAEGKHLAWVAGKNNWTQVCHAGLVAGALAVHEEYPELAARIIRRALDKVPAAMRASYAPNGAYPEGPSYWMYGTEYAMVLVELLQSTLESDFGLSQQPGFDKTGEYLIAMQAPSGVMFSYADSNLRRDFGPARLWWMKQFRRPDCYSLWTRRLLDGYLNVRRKRVSRGGGHRLMPLAMFFLDGLPNTPSSQQPLAYCSGDAVNPVVMFRSDSGEQATYLGIKGGSPGNTHCHMDGGGFILEAQGVRWVLDLGGDNYLKQESSGIDLWNMGQDSSRWSLFRLGVASHNILVIDDERQKVAGKGRIVEFSGDPGRQSTVFDLSELYAGSATGVFRRATLRPDRTVVIQDRLRGLKPGSRVRWQFCTQADGEEIGSKELTLVLSKKRLRVRTTEAVRWNIAPAWRFSGPNDSPNSQVKMVYFDVVAPDSGIVELEVQFISEKE